jgi:hypothetical protein
MSGFAEGAAPMAANVPPPIQEYDANESAEPRTAPLLFKKVRMEAMDHDLLVDAR